MCFIPVLNGKPHCVHLHMNLNCRTLDLYFPDILLFIILFSFLCKKLYIRNWRNSVFIWFCCKTLVVIKDMEEWDYLCNSQTQKCLSQKNRIHKGVFFLFLLWTKRKCAYRGALFNLEKSHWYCQWDFVST